MKTNPKIVEKLVIKSFDVLNGELPDPAENCEYCKWNQEIIKI